mmetsp:Transcript_10420/g.15921  ORF Transcript_10420/g.15921 Transcript_10420/m.15921 type:complete len:775 (-) Transcript_10420:120-2444(-)
MKNRRKAERVLTNIASSSESDDSSENDDDGRAVAALPVTSIRKRTGPRNRVSKSKRLKVENPELCLVDGKEEENVPFCCAVCKCPRSVKHRLEEGNKIGTRLHWIEPSQGQDLLDHRMCCHGLIQRANESLEDFGNRKYEWVNPCLAAQMNFDVESLDAFCCDRRRLEWIDQRTFKKAYDNAKDQEARIYNEDKLEHETDKFHFLTPKYNENYVQPFELRVKRIKDGTEKHRSATVLDCFAGIGTGIVVLKKLGIAIKKIIYIEHDKVARHVYRSNHDRKYYNMDAGEKDKMKKSKKKLKHVYEYETWESLVGEAKHPHTFDKHKIKEFISKHGHIDIMLGGPPCIEYSGANAYRKGANSKQGRYLTQFGEVVNHIQSLQKETPLYYLAENVVVRRDDRAAIGKSFQLDHDPINLDAQYFSPARRNRNFWTNIPFADFEYADSGTGSRPRTCFEDGFYLPEEICEDGIYAKCNCFMSSKSKIDDNQTVRMYVFQKNPKDKKFYGRPFTVLERERLMGYPEGYVEKPVRKLFDKLTEDALKLNSKNESKWQSQLHSKYHCFAGNYHEFPWEVCKGDFHRFETTVVPEVKLKLAPHFSGTLKNEDDSNYNIDFFDAEEYAKHLVGLAYSVPVVEHLLKPLQQIFKPRWYEGFSEHQYKWAHPPASPAAAPGNQRQDAERKQGTQQETSPQQMVASARMVAIKEESTDEEEDRKMTAVEEDHTASTIPRKSAAAKEENAIFTIPRKVPALEKAQAALAAVEETQAAFTIPRKLCNRV